MTKHTSHLSEALEQISEIHEHLNRSEVYRGYRSVPIALSGFAGLAAAALQSRLATDSSHGFVQYWVWVAAIAGAVGAAEIAYNYLFRDDAAARRKTRQALGQFAPPVIAAVGTTAVLARNPDLVPLLSGLWALFFGLGVFASRTCLPHAIGWVALYYVVAGWWLLITAHDPGALSGWRVGGVFALGQLASGLVLYWNIERRNGANAEFE